VAWVKIGSFRQITCYNSKKIQDHFVTSCCGCYVTLRRCVILHCAAIIMYCMHVRNNCLKASHNLTISCRRFGFRGFCLSPLWPCLLSPFKHVTVLTFAVLVCRRFDCEPLNERRSQYNWSRSVIFEQVPIIWCKYRENQSTGS